MNSWRDLILKEFTPQVARLTLVADPDALLLEEGILQGIRERGFELIPFDDAISFRFAYESRFRSRWDRGEDTEIVVVLRSDLSELDKLPYDLLQAGRKLSFNLGELFPDLCYPAVDALNRSDFDPLYQAQSQYKPNNLGENDTKDFILRHVFGIAPELIKQSSDLLRTLLRRHYRSQTLPSGLDERLLQLLRKNELFDDWPLEKIVPDRKAFFLFLQERWPAFLDSITESRSGKICEAQAPYGFQYPGPLYLPFDHDDIRIYIDNLFLEGLLKPVPHQKTEELSETWALVGLQTDPESDHSRRLKRLFESIEANLPSPEAIHQDWLAFAYRWAELNGLVFSPSIKSSNETLMQMTALQEKVDKDFNLWIEQRYAGLYNLPPSPPIMVHHIPRIMARALQQPPKKKFALIVVDGLALSQWLIIRDEIGRQFPRLSFRENSVFAWIPTITSVSRQAVFAGKPPIYFPGSIYKTERESSLWTQFWIDQGLNQAQIVYLKGVGEESLEKVETVISNPKIVVSGLVVDKVDKIMHGMELGTSGMHNQILQWAKEGFITGLIDLLHKYDFEVMLTSDHGNIEAKGCGRPSEGVLADSRGERARIYSNEILRSKIKELFPAAIEWPLIGLPNDFYPLLAPNRAAFINEGERTVGHGGISVEEVIVPLISIERK